MITKGCSSRRGNIRTKQCQKFRTKNRNKSWITLSFTPAKKAPSPVKTKEIHNFLSGTTLFMMYAISTVVRIEHLLKVKNLYILWNYIWTYNGMLTSLTLYKPKSTVTKFDRPILNPMCIFCLTSLIFETRMPIESRNWNESGLYCL